MALANTSATPPRMQSSSSSIHLPSESSSSATLRSLYQRAAKSFLHRDFGTTQSFIASAFELLSPPSSSAAVNDAYASHRRKWDLLRITLETTAYASPPERASDLPEALRSNALQPSQSLLTTLLTRSLRLFTPQPHQPTAAFLPAQILLTHSLGALKLENPQFAREIVEEWLACRRPPADGEQVAEELEGYDKVLELYCLHVLPRLDEWEYAKEFLSYERELPVDRRQSLISAVENAHEEVLISKREDALRSASATPVQRAVPNGSISPSRTPSPALSASSSSASSTSTHTARPMQRSGIQPLSTLSKITSSTTHSAQAPPAAVIPARGEEQPTTSVEVKPLPTPPRAPALQVTPVHPPTTLHVIRASAQRYLSLFSTRAGRLPFAAIFSVLAVLLPLLAWFSRLKTGARAPAVPKAHVPSTSAASVRRKLGAVPSARQGVLGTVWGETIRAIGDTIRMAGKGLV